MAITYGGRHPSAQDGSFGQSLTGRHFLFVFVALRRGSKKVFVSNNRGWRVHSPLVRWLNSWWIPRTCLRRWQLSNFGRGEGGTLSGPRDQLNFCLWASILAQDAYFFLVFPSRQVSALLWVLVSISSWKELRRRFTSTPNDSQLTCAVL